jgi:hypothetical protein
VFPEGPAKTGDLTANPYSTGPARADGPSFTKDGDGPAEPNDAHDLHDLHDLSGTSPANGANGRHSAG